MENLFNVLVLTQILFPDEKILVRKDMEDSELYVVDVLSKGVVEEKYKMQQLIDDFTSRAGIRNVFVNLTFVK